MKKEIIFVVDSRLIEMATGAKKTMAFVKTFLFLAAVIAAIALWICSDFINIYVRFLLTLIAINATVLLVVLWSRAAHQESTILPCENRFTFTNDGFCPTDACHEYFVAWNNVKQIRFEDELCALHYYVSSDSKERIIAIPIHSIDEELEFLLRSKS